MAEIVYGGCVEPGGMSLDSGNCEVECPECGKSAVCHYWEAAEGGALNTYESIKCPHCLHFESDFDIDDY